MKIKDNITLFCLLLTISGLSTAQNYIKRLAEDPVYDVEVIVFGQTLAQPPLSQIKQADIFDQESAAEVDFIPTDSVWPKIKKPDPPPTENQPQDSSQVPLTDVEPEYQVLVWYLLANQLTGGVVDRLASNPKYKPIIRQIWRQPATPFKNPLYVKVNSMASLDKTEETADKLKHSKQQPWFDVNAVTPYDKTTDETLDNGSSKGSANNDFVTDGNQHTFSLPKQTITDYQVNGQVALTQGRFTHLHIQFNYYRINDEGKTIIYATKQQKQIDLNQWQYFDHQQFGVLIKVTAVTAEELL